MEKGCMWSIKWLIKMKNLLTEYVIGYTVRTEKQVHV